MKLKLKSLILAAFILLSSSAAFAGWTITQLDTVTNVYQLCLLVDSNDLSRVVYRAKFVEQIAPDTWNYTTIYDTAPTSSFPSAALDSSDNVYVASGKRFAVRTGKVWRITNSTVLPADYDSLLVDANNDYHIVMSNWDINNNDVRPLKYGKYNKTTGVWDWEIITTFDVSNHASFPPTNCNTIVADAAGNLHVFYHDLGTFYFMHAYKTGTTWTTERIGAEPYAGRSNSVVIGNNGHIYVVFTVDAGVSAYVKDPLNPWQPGTPIEDMDQVLGTDSYHTNDASAKLDFAEYDGATWTIETVDPDLQKYYSRGVSLAVDSNYQPYIAYVEPYAAVSYATKVGGVWTTENIAVGAAQFIPVGVSIKFNKAEIPLVAYSTNLGVYYAVYHAPRLDWTGEDNYSQVGVYPSTGTITEVFTFRTAYSDAKDHAPAAGYPKVHIMKDGLDITGSPFTMSAVNSLLSGYVTPAVYTYATSLPEGAYTYKYEAFDSEASPAIGPATVTQDGPTVGPVLKTVVESEGVKIQGGPNGYVNPDKGEKASIIVRPTNSGTISICVYTMSGRLVYTTSADVVSDTTNVIEWACINDSSETLASGIYIIKITGAGLDIKTKVAVIR